MADNNPAKPPVSGRPDRRSRTHSASNNPYRFVLRLIGIPVLALAGVFIYRGLLHYFVLPECDSETAKKTLSDVLKQLQLEPTRYDQVKTVSTSKTEVVCTATMPLPDGASVIADYTFYWQGNKANMRYSIQRRAAQPSPPPPSPSH